jgi:hypothetical protein
MLVDDELLLERLLERLLEMHLDWQSCGSNAPVEVSRTTAAIATMSNISARHKLFG